MTQADSFQHLALLRKLLLTIETVSDLRSDRGTYVQIGVLCHLGRQSRGRLVPLALRLHQ